MFVRQTFLSSRTFRNLNWKGVSWLWAPLTVEHNAVLFLPISHALVVIPYGTAHKRQVLMSWGQFYRLGTRPVFLIHPVEKKGAIFSPLTPAQLCCSISYHGLSSALHPHATSCSVRGSVSDCVAVIPQGLRTIPSWPIRRRSSDMGV